MRNKLVGMIVTLTSVLVAGCSASGNAPEDGLHSAESGAGSTPSVTDSAGVDLPKRTGPQKSIDLAKVCDIVSKPQWRALGADQFPEKRESNGTPVCQYQKGAAGADGNWHVDIGIDRNRSMQDFIQTHSGGQALKINGYPAYQSKESTGCLYYVDVSNKGSLLVNGVGGITADGSTPSRCPLFKKFAEAAVKNRPNA